MSHQRFRKFNTSTMYDGHGQAINNDVCMIVKAGNHVFLRGQTGFDLDGSFVGAGDAGASKNAGFVPPQKRTALANVKSRKSAALMSSSSTSS